MSSVVATQKRVIASLLKQVEKLKAQNSALKSAAGETETETFLKDYQRPFYLVPDVQLDFILNDDFTVVRSKLSVKRASGSESEDFLLDGEDLEVQSISIDGTSLLPSEYEIKDNVLRIPAARVSEKFEFSATVHIKPQDNLQLSGLYKSSGMFCSQCEAEGFRRITFIPDRPDVMSSYKVRVEADKKQYPVLLSNGNLTEATDLEGGRHSSVWVDPWPKPSYLFALVAGDLGHIEDKFVTMSGKEVRLVIYTEHKNVGQLQYCMEGLQKAMKWDEEKYGREYDLELFNIVAVEDFNMGAMENKSLNVFNTKYVLALPETATDENVETLQGVVAHEYFHNWTGNRVTLNNWFQLTLKEGLTVFRDQSFTADMTSAAVKRIDDVSGLRVGQFEEDAGPMSHPIRPESYICMDNFYTWTVYEKGAEVIRMYHTLVGEKGFRKGTDLYFDRHDGQAVSCDDFRHAIADAQVVMVGSEVAKYTARVLRGQFENWYKQSGTPVVTVRHSFDNTTGRFTLSLRQRYDGKDADKKQPVVLPVVLGLLHPTTGAEIAPSATLVSDSKVAVALFKERQLLVLTDAQRDFVFDCTGCEGLPAGGAVASVLRNFSAPVRLEYEPARTGEELSFLMAHDGDPFNRYEAGQQYALALLMSLVNDTSGDLAAAAAAAGMPKFVQAVKMVLEAEGLDNSIKAYTLRLPALKTILMEMRVIDTDVAAAARAYVRRQLASQLRAEFLHAYHACEVTEAYQVEPGQVGKRRLRNTCLGYLSSLASGEGGTGEEQAVVDLCVAQFNSASNMTESQGALGCLVHIACPEREQALAAFEAKWSEDSLVMDKWFTLQALSSLPGTLGEVKKLMSHPKFTLKNPNKARALVSAFVKANPVQFHAKDGSGYAFLADLICEVDSFNNQMAAQLARGFLDWKKYDGERQKMMRAQLERVKKLGGLSKDTFEIVNRALS